MDKEKLLLVSLVDKDVDEAFKNQIKMLIPECFTAKKDTDIFDHLKREKDVTDLDPEYLSYLMEIKESEQYKTFSMFDNDSKSSTVTTVLEEYKKNKTSQYLDEFNYAILNGGIEVQNELDKFIKKLSKLPSIIHSITAEDAVQQVLEDLKESIELDKRPVKETQFKKLNKDLGGGMKPGDIMMVFGPSNVGKTPFVQNLVSHFCNQGDKVLYNTTEMTAKQLIEEFMCIEATKEGVNGVNKSAFTNPSEGSLKAIQYIGDKLSGQYLTMVPVNTPGDVIREVHKKPFDVVVVDHVHDLAGIADSDPSVTEEFMGELKSWAVANEKIVILLGQPRKGGADRDPTRRVTKDDIKYAQVLQSKPSFIIGLYRDPETNILEAEQLKNRWYGDKVGEVSCYSYRNGLLTEVK